MFSFLYPTLQRHMQQQAPSFAEQVHALQAHSTQAAAVASLPQPAAGDRSAARPDTFARLRALPKALLDGGRAQLQHALTPPTGNRATADLDPRTTCEMRAGQFR